ncbi:MAG TPA: hypothetical protein VIU93_08600 [Gallionellaceae bacterium]
MKTNSFFLNDEARKGNIAMTRQQVRRERKLVIEVIIFLAAGAGSLVFALIPGNMAAVLMLLLLSELALLSILI